MACAKCAPRSVFHGALPSTDTGSLYMPCNQEVNGFASLLGRSFWCLLGTFLGNLFQALGLCLAILDLNLGRACSLNFGSFRAKCEGLGASILNLNKALGLNFGNFGVKFGLSSGLPFWQLRVAEGGSRGPWVQGFKGSRARGFKSHQQAP